MIENKKCHRLKYKRQWVNVVIFDSVLWLNDIYKNNKISDSQLIDH